MSSGSAVMHELWRTAGCYKFMLSCSARDYSYAYATYSRTG